LIIAAGGEAEQTTYCLDGHLDPPRVGTVFDHVLAPDLYVETDAGEIPFATAIANHVISFEPAPYKVGPVAASHLAALGLPDPSALALMPLAEGAATIDKYVADHPTLDGLQRYRLETLSDELKMGSQYADYSRAVIRNKSSGQVKIVAR